MDPRILDRVRSAIAELGYHPNHIARSFKTGSTPLIGLLLPSMSNPVYGSLAREIETVAMDKHGLRILIGNSYRDINKERDFLKDLMGHGVKGVIVVSPQLEQPHYRECIERGLVVVSYDRRASPETDVQVDYVSIDNFEAAFIATRHLIDNGHKHLAYVTPALKTMARTDKIRGFQAAADQAGLAESAFVIDGGIASYYEDAEMVKLGYNIAREIASPPTRPTGVVAMNDLMAIGLISGLEKSGLAVPADISVVGMDDLFLSEIITPGITSVSAPFASMAETMVDRIVQRLQSNGVQASEFIFRPTLTIRDSVGRARTEAGTLRHGKT